MKSRILASMLAATASLSCLTLPIFQAEAKEEATPVLKMSPALMREDLTELASNIKLHHPRPFRVISEERFDELVAEGTASLDENANRADLLWAMSGILSSIGCAHSSMPHFNQEDALIEVGQRFPVEVRMYGGRLFVMDPLSNADQLSIGQEIVSINGISVADLRNEIFAHIGADTNIPNFKEPAFNFYATSYLTYALNFAESYELTVRGDTKPITLAPLEDFSPKPIISPQAECQESLCYSIDEQRNIGIMTIRSFDYYGSDGQIFADFTAAAFDDLAASNRAGLLIDVRGVLGGSGLVGSYLLRHLAKEPFAYFDNEMSDPRGNEGLQELQRPISTGFEGPTYILMDGLTVSSVSHFLALAKENNIATLIGEPSGGGKSTSDGKIRLAASHSGITYTVARMRFDVAAPSLSIDEAVRPDIRLAYSLDDVLKRSDTMRDNALDLLALHAGS